MTSLTKGKLFKQKHVNFKFNLKNLHLWSWRNGKEIIMCSFQRSKTLFNPFLVLSIWVFVAERTLIYLSLRNTFILSTQITTFNKLQAKRSSLKFVENSGSIRISLFCTSPFVFCFLIFSLYLLLQMYYFFFVS